MTQRRFRFTRITTKLKRRFLSSFFVFTIVAVLYAKFGVPSTAQIPISDLLAESGISKLEAPVANLGDSSSTPFLSRGWEAPSGQDYRIAKRGGAEVRFYASQRVNLKLELEGKAPSLRARVQVLNSSKSVREIFLSDAWSSESIEISKENVIQGLNKLLLLSDEKVCWRKCSLKVMYEENPPCPPPTRERVCLPFGKTLEVTTLLEPSSSLVFDKVEEWLEPGAASLHFSPTLEVRIQASGNLDQTWVVPGTGYCKINLPIRTKTLVNLSIGALATVEPLPGQSGLALRNPRIEGIATPIVPSASSSSLPLAASTGQLTSKPNVILYVVDTLRTDRLGCYGSPAHRTPNFDELARGAVVFESCMAQSSWTKAATASIMTSLLPEQHGAQDFQDKLQQNPDILAAVLQKSGYETYGFVANPFVGKDYGFAQGFSQYKERPQADAQKLTTEVLSFLASRTSKRPYFLYIHVLDPHLPYSPPARFRSVGLPVSFTVEEMKNLREAWEANGESPRLRRLATLASQLYDGEVYNCDDAFGRLVKKLKSKGEFEDSLVILTSDHGEQFFEHSICDHMNSLYQELVHVPLILKFPHQLNAGTVVQGVWQQIDIAPTILNIAGIVPPESMQGIPYIPGSKEALNRPAFFSLHVGLHSARYGQGDDVARADIDGVRVGEWVLHQVSSTIVDLEPRLLFNLKTDPSQNNNLAYSRPEIRSWLHSLLSQTMTHSQATRSPVSGKVWRNSLLDLQYLR